VTGGSAVGPVQRDRQVVDVVGTGAGMLLGQLERRATRALVSLARVLERAVRRVIDVRVVIGPVGSPVAPPETVDERVAVEREELVARCELEPTVPVRVLARTSPIATIRRVAG